MLFVWFLVLYHAVGGLRIARWCGAMRLRFFHCKEKALVWSARAIIVLFVFLECNVASSPWFGSCSLSAAAGNLEERVGVLRGFTRGVCSNADFPVAFSCEAPHSGWQRRVLGFPGLRTPLVAMGALFVSDRRAPDVTKSRQVIPPTSPRVDLKMSSSSRRTYPSFCILPYFSCLLPLL